MHWSCQWFIGNRWKRFVSWFVIIQYVHLLYAALAPFLLKCSGAADAMRPKADAHLPAPPQQQRQQWCNSSGATAAPAPARPRHVLYKLWRHGCCFLAAHCGFVAQCQKVVPPPPPTSYCISLIVVSTCVTCQTLKWSSLFAESEKKILSRGKIPVSRHVKLWCATGQIYWDGDEFCDYSHQEDSGESGGERKVLTLNLGASMLYRTGTVGGICFARKIMSSFGRRQKKNCTRNIGICSGLVYENTIFCASLLKIPVKR